MTERPLTKRQQNALIMMPNVYLWTEGSLPSLLRRGLVERERVVEHGRAHWAWRLTEAGAEVADALRAARRALRDGAS
jgi:hypothetical protein